MVQLAQSPQSSAQTSAGVGTQALRFILFPPIQVNVVLSPLCTERLDWQCLCCCGFDVFMFLKFSGIFFKFFMEQTF